MSDGLKIIYDGDCPFCARYVAMVRLQAAVGPVELIDARSGHPLARELTERGYDLNDGMALVAGEDIYFGEDCIHRLALLSTSSGVFNKLNAAIFRSERLSRGLYPILRTGRNLTLRALGRRPLEL